MKDLEQEVKELRRANAILKSASPSFAAELDRPQKLVDYIDAHRDKFGVEPICTVLQTAPSTHYAAKQHGVSARAVRDAVRDAVMMQVWMVLWVNRNFTAGRPDPLWVTDLTYVPTRSGIANVCFIVDAFSRDSSGEQASKARQQPRPRGQRHVRWVIG